MYVCSSYDVPIVLSCCLVVMDVSSVFGIVVCRCHTAMTSDNAIDQYATPELGTYLAPRC